VLLNVSPVGHELLLMIVPLTAPWDTVANVIDVLDRGLMNFSVSVMPISHLATPRSFHGVTQWYMMYSLTGMRSVPWYM